MFSWCLWVIEWMEVCCRKWKKPSELRHRGYYHEAHSESNSWSQASMVGQSYPTTAHEIWTSTEGGEDKTNRSSIASTIMVKWSPPRGCEFPHNSCLGLSGGQKSLSHWSAPEWSAGTSELIWARGMLEGWAYDFFLSIKVTSVAEFGAEKWNKASRWVNAVLEKVG